MKNLNFLALIAVAALASTANAQNADEPKVPLRDVPTIGSLFLAKRYAGVRLSTKPVLRDFNAKLTVEIVRQDTGNALRHLAGVLGVNIVIDPAIQFLPAATRILGFSDVKDDFFADVSETLIKREPIEMWKSAAGTYFFAAKTAPVLDELEITLDKHNLESEKRGGNPDPFNANPSPTNRAVPQPNWEKREFNGREFYYIPMPRNPQ